MNHKPVQRFRQLNLIVLCAWDFVGVAALNVRPTRSERAAPRRSANDSDAEQPGYPSTLISRLMARSDLSRSNRSHEFAMSPANEHRGLLG
jgi:hypothetical protein